MKQEMESQILDIGIYSKMKLIPKRKINLLSHAHKKMNFCQTSIVFVEKMLAI